MRAVPACPSEGNRSRRRNACSWDYLQSIPSFPELQGEKGTAVQTRVTRPRCAAQREIGAWRGHRRDKRESSGRSSGRTQCRKFHWNDRFSPVIFAEEQSAGIWKVQASCRGNGNHVFTITLVNARSSRYPGIFQAHPRLLMKKFGSQIFTARTVRGVHKYPRLWIREKISGMPP